MSQYAGIDASAADSDSADPRAPRAPAGASVDAGVRRPGVDDGEVDRGPARLGRPERGDQRVGPGAGLVLRADLGLGAPRRLAEQDRPPRVADRRGHAPVARLGVARRRRPRPRRAPSGRPGGAARIRRGRRRRPAARPATRRRRSPGPTARRPRRDRGRWRAPSGGSRPAGRGTGGRSGTSRARRARARTGSTRASEMNV